jgi:prefoldin subunit 5
MFKRLVRRVRRVLNTEVLDELVYLREQMAALRAEQAQLHAELRLFEEVLLTLALGGGDK